MNLTIAICSCINLPDRLDYLKKCMKTFGECFPGAEIRIGFDKFGADIEGATCFTHDKGMGHSWNWAIEGASNDLILQTEDDWDIILGQIEMPDKKSLLDLISKNTSVIDEHGGIYKLDNLEKEWWLDGHEDMELNGYDFCKLNRPEKEPKWAKDYSMYYYSNHPHLKSKKLHQELGGYLENAPPHEVEIDMCKKYWRHKAPVFFSKFNMFVHIGTESSRKAVS